MKYLIINADDFGLNQDVNEGVIRAFISGAVSNATIMIKREAFRDALSFARENRNFNVGLHLDLDNLLDFNRISPEPGDAQARFSPARISKLLESGHVLKNLDNEIEDQIKLFKNSGLPLSHIDGHHHLHAHPLIFPRLVEKMIKHDIHTVRIAENYDLVTYPPIEWEPSFYNKMKGFLLKNSITAADHFISGITSHGLKDLKKGVTELMTHPGIKEPWRLRDLETISSEEWKEEMKARDIKLISFKDLHFRQ